MCVWMHYDWPISAYNKHAIESHIVNEAEFLLHFYLQQCESKESIYSIQCGHASYIVAVALKLSNLGS